MVPQQDQHQPGQMPAPPKHVPMRQITYQALLRSLGAEHEALQKIHVRIQQQLRNLEVEEKLIKQMIQRERNLHSSEELSMFDREQQEEEQLRRQQQPDEQWLAQSQQPEHPETGSGGPHQPGIEQLQQQQPEPLQQQEPARQLHREEMEGVEMEEF